MLSDSFGNALLVVGIEMAVAAIDEGLENNQHALMFTLDFRSESDVSKLKSYNRTLGAFLGHQQA